MIERPILHGALFVSLALNVFVGGAFVGSRLKQETPPPAAAAPAGGARNPVIAAVRTLSPEHQAAWREQGAAFAQAHGPQAREARQLARTTMRSFADEPFDAEAAMANLARARALEHENRVAMDQRLVTFAATLPQAERARFGEALARPRLGRGGGAGNGGRPALADR